VTVITPGAGCSITSTATVSITGVTGCFTFRAAFFTGAGLGLALATVRFAFAALDTLGGLPRLAEFPFRSFARFCTFDAFLRLAMIDPLVWFVLCATHWWQIKRRPANLAPTYQQMIPEFSNPRFDPAPLFAIAIASEEDGAIVFREACKLGCEGIVSKRLGSPYRSGRSAHWVKVKNPKAPAVKREAEEDWGR
jgi:hypothetical protein